MQSEKRHFFILLATVHKFSVTRFGEISPFWQHVKILWHLFLGLLSILQNFAMTLATVSAFWQIFIFVNDQKLNK